MKLCLLSDTHTHTPHIEDCDLVLHAGDFTHAGKDIIRGLTQWYAGIFPALQRVAEKRPVVATWGNHDLIGEHHPQIIEEAKQYNIHILNHSGYIFKGIFIFGTPVQPVFCNWAFNKPSKTLESYYNNIGTCDILITHCPPHGILDPGFGDPHVGSRELKEALQYIKPRLHTFGHCHGGYGISIDNNTTYVNAALVDENYQLSREPIYLEWL